MTYERVYKKERQWRISEKKKAKTSIWNKKSFKTMKSNVNIFKITYERSQETNT